MVDWGPIKGEIDHLKAKAEREVSYKPHNPNDKALRSAVNLMISEENPPEAFMSHCCFCGGLIPVEERGKTLIWFSEWLQNIVWACPSCYEWIMKQKEPDIAEELTLIKRAQKKGYA